MYLNLMEVEALLSVLDEIPQLKCGTHLVRRRGSRKRRNTRVAVKELRLSYDSLLYTHHISLNYIP